MAEHHFEIELTAHGQGTVKLDGSPLKNIRGFRLEAGVDSVNTLTLFMLADSLTIVGVADVTKLNPTAWKAEE